MLSYEVLQVIGFVNCLSKKNNSESVLHLYFIPFILHTFVSGMTPNCLPPLMIAVTLAFINCCMDKKT